jgi:copper chaperone CopZ
MTCGHCVQSVSDEVGALPGVAKVEVELTTGAVTMTVTMTSEAPLDNEAVRAVDVAGYQLVG